VFLVKAGNTDETNQWVNFQGLLVLELIITAGGENIAPVPIEGQLKVEVPILSNAMLIGDKKKFLSCLLTLKVRG
jgi:long-subunit acyl-CoA synthetase (AMP-forming)